MISSKFCTNLKPKLSNTLTITSRLLSTSTAYHDNHKCKILVLGGGSGGCAMAAKFANKFDKGQVIVVEQCDKHYYQPMFTLIGGGIKTLSASWRPMGSTLPTKATWIQDKVTEIEPAKNTVFTERGAKIEYDILLLGLGLELHYEAIPGLVEALNTPKSGVGSNYSPLYVEKTYDSLQRFKSGNAIFTYPNSAVKCPGAPQKIMYLSEDYFKKHNMRDRATITYNTSLPVIFGVQHYAKSLLKIVEKRKINVNFRTNLVEVNHVTREAIFENLDKPGERMTMDYGMLHVAPPMYTPNVLRLNQDLVNEAGFVEVNKDSMQHVRYNNIFAIGDNSSSPNSKTTAAAAAQSPVIYKNILSVLKGKKPKAVYDGYASCPLVTSYTKCILAEFNYDLVPLETFPLQQDKERYTMMIMKRDVMPPLYWELMTRGMWNGPGAYRKMLSIVKFDDSNQLAEKLHKERKESS